jgi:hypothetical protein
LGEGVAWRSRDEESAGGERALSASAFRGVASSQAQRREQEIQNHGARALSLQEARVRSCSISLSLSTKRAEERRGGVRDTGAEAPARRAMERRTRPSEEKKRATERARAIGK